MKFDVSYVVCTTNNTIWYTEDNDLNFDNSPIEACSEAEALIRFKEIITELMNCNCLGVEVGEKYLSVYEPCDRELIERYHSFRVSRLYKLINGRGKEYWSRTPGTFAGHRKLKIYGKLDCPSANRYLSKGQNAEHRVFFEDEEPALSAGYRPCAKCMRKKYLLWKEGNKTND